MAFPSPRCCGACGSPQSRWLSPLPSSRARRSSSHGHMAFLLGGMPRNEAKQRPGQSQGALMLL